MAIQVDEVRRDPVVGIARYLDEERRLPLCLRGKGLIIEVAGKKALEAILKQR